MQKKSQGSLSKAYTDIDDFISDLKSPIHWTASEIADYLSDRINYGEPIIKAGDAIAAIGATGEIGTAKTVMLDLFDDIQTSYKVHSTVDYLVRITSGIKRSHNSTVQNDLIPDAVDYIYPLRNHIHNTYSEFDDLVKRWPPSRHLQQQPQTQTQPKQQPKAKELIEGVVWWCPTCGNTTPAHVGEKGKDMVCPVCGHEYLYPRTVSEQDIIYPHKPEFGEPATSIPSLRERFKNRYRTSIKKAVRILKKFWS